MAKSKRYDLKELEECISLLDENKKKIALGLLDKAIFLEDQLQLLQEDIRVNGLNVEMCQGQYSITRANPSCTTYNAFLKQFTSICSQIGEMMPKEEQKEKDEFDL